MKKITTLSFVLATLFYLICANVLIAQSMLREIPLKQQIDNSSLVVEGKVIAKKSFWDVNYHNIYTVNTVEVYKVFKGEKLSIIEVVTPGGSVNGQAEFVSPSLKLHKGDIGVFTLYSNNVPFSSENKSSTKKFKAYSSLQGFYRYNLYTDVAVNPLRINKGITTSFYQEIEKITKGNYQKITNFNIESKQLKTTQSKNGILAPGAIVFLPITTTAGTASEITITGTGFGATITPGKVGFSNADDGGVTFIDALDTQIISWSDTEIMVQVPSGAGTGPVRVTNDDTTIGVSVADLTVTYSQLNAVDDFWSVGKATDYAYEIRHVDDTDSPASGGYTWEMFTDFFDDTEHPGAKASFERALDTWRCDSKINWGVSSSATGVDMIASDGVNVVRFDNGTELEAGTAGVCTSRWSSCGFPDDPTSAIWHVVELDIVFDAELDWEVGPALAAGSKFDFESVALHELGHGHQLGHVIDATGAVMHYAITNAENIRTLTPGDSAGAGDVQDRSTSIVACGQVLMTDSTVCNLSVEEDELANAISIFPNPATSEFFIKNESFINLEKAVIYDVSGREISKYDLSETSRIKSINVQNLSKGIYIINIHSDNASISKRLVVK